MCKQMIPIKPKNPYNIKRAYVPCGKCDECRLMIKTEWTNRLLSEMDYYQKKFKYKVGFITLTYNDAHLPHIPKKFLVNENEKIPCFNYEDIKRLNNTLRKFLWSKFNLKNGYRHFITCEYGEKKHRPHMHGIILFNPMFTHLEFYRFIEDAWTGTTYYIQNNNKRKTQREEIGIISPYESFVPKDTHNCGAYVAKYVCKDIEYEESIKEKIKDNLTEKEKHELRHYAPFHRQSLGLARCLIDNDTKSLLKEYKEGIDLMGSTKKKELPNYIKEKIFYTQHNTYNLKLHRFEQTKKYTQTYFENKLKVYTKKYEQNKKLFEKLQTKEYWELKIADNRTKFWKTIPTDISEIVKWAKIEEITKFYTIYYGVPYQNCMEGKAEEILFQRYNPCSDQTNKKQINEDYYNAMTECCDIIMGYASITDKQKRSKQQEIKDKIKAFWNNVRQ